MLVTIDNSGTMRLVYTEALDLPAIGSLAITPHVSHVEPDENGQWWADLAPIQGPKLGPFARRSECVAAEVAWIEENAL
jgi:hypothetical protein